MKIPIICDTHFGYKNDSPIFREYFNDFFQKIFFPYIEQNNIREIIHLGDLMDRRKYVNIDTARYIRENFIEKLEKLNVTMHVLLGNHDVYYKNTNTTNSIKELFQNSKSVKIYDQFQDATIAGFSFAMFPWICEENHQEFLDFIGKSTSKVAMGHFELQGYEVLRGIKSEEGLSKDVLQKFQNVYSGHFHQKNGDGHINYLGTQYDMNFSDTEETKGFHIFYTETSEIEFIRNPQKMYYRIVYDDTIEFDFPDFSKYKNTYVKLVVKNKKSSKIFDKYLAKLYEVNPHEVNIVDEFELTDTSADNIDITQDTLSIICKDIEENKNYDPQIINSLKKFMTDLYLESFEVEND